LSTGRIISVHSYRGGTGKSNLTANMAALLASSGLRIGVVDTDIQSPGIHVIFGMNQEQLSHSLNDYLWGLCSIEQAAYDVSPQEQGAQGGALYLIPSSIEAGEITRVLREGFDPGLLNDGFLHLLETLELDALLIDTHPGLNEETLLSIAISDALLVILRPDRQDYLGTSVTVDIARRLDVPKMRLIVNKVPAIFDEAQVRLEVESAYGCTVAAILPHSDEMMALGSGGLFVNRYPENEITDRLRQVAGTLLATSGSPD